MNARSRTAHGHPITAASVVGSFTLALVVLLRVAGFFAGVDAGFRDWYQRQGFAIGSPDGQPWWDVLLMVPVIYGLVWLLFETPGLTRRVLVLLTAEVLLMTASLVAALWGVFWAPTGLVLGVASGGLCAILWARQHPMPCELAGAAADQLDSGKIVPMKREEKKPEKEAGAANDAQRNGSEDGK